jgi:hypothetical protein
MSKAPQSVHTAQMGTSGSPFNRLMTWMDRGLAGEGSARILYMYMDAYVYGFVRIDWAIEVYIYRARYDLTNC